MIIKSFLFELKLWWKGRSLPPALADVSIEVDKVFRELLKNPRFTDFIFPFVSLNGIKIYLPSGQRGPLVWEEDAPIYYLPKTSTSALFYIEYEKALKKYRQDELSERIENVKKF